MKTKKYVVAILNFFDNEIHQFVIHADSKYSAAKTGLILVCASDAAKQSELEWQESEDYPQTYEDLVQTYEETAISVIKITEETF